MRQSERLPARPCCGGAFVALRFATARSVPFLTLATIVAATLLPSSPGAVLPARAESIELLNVSYDPTRELYRAINGAFAKSYQQESGNTVSIKQSHGGSSTQARAVIDGLAADVVTLAMWPDTNAIHKSGLIDAGWEEKLPNRSTPYTSTIVFVVRKGNPKGIKDWGDILKDPSTQVVTPNPKTSGNGKLSFLAAWGSITQRGGSEADALKFITELYKRAPVLDTGARGATTTFVQKGIGDVHLAWENEAHLEIEEAKGEVELVSPPISILAEPHVALVDANVRKRNTTAAATAYLKFLYTPAAQDIIATNFYRPSDPDALKRHAANFTEIALFPITAVAKNWDDAQARYFADGGVFDRIYSPSAK